MSRVIRRWPIAASSLAAVVLAACGSSSDDGGSTTRPETNAAPAGFEQFRRCMRDEGVDVPGPSQGGPPAGGAPPVDPGDEKVRQALESCRDELPEGAAPGGPRGGAPPAGGDAPETPSA